MTDFFLKRPETIKIILLGKALGTFKKWSTAEDLIERIETKLSPSERREALQGAIADFREFFKPLKRRNVFSEN